MNKLIVSLILTTATVFTMTCSRQASARTSDADEWLTDIETGVKIWNPSPSTEAKETVLWHGAPGAASGHGVAIWLIHGNMTEQADGEWNEGKLDGYAVWQHSGGDRFEGAWHNGKKHGHGVYTWPDGRRFCGLYQDGVRQEGAIYGRNGKPTGPEAPSATLRKLILDAEEAALKARKTATLAKRKAALAR